MKRNLDLFFAAVGTLIIQACANTGKIVILFLETCKRINEANFTETVRQMAKLGADSLPIVVVTTMCTGMVLAVQTAKEFDVILSAPLQPV